MHDRGLCRHLDNRRMDVSRIGMGVCQSLAAAVHVATFGLGLLQCAVHGGHGIRVDQWANEGAVGERVADWQACVGFDKARDQGVVDVFVHDQAAQGGAALTCGADG